MSNKQVPAIYRTIINDVIENVRPDFDEVGIEEAVLLELLRSWEDKVAISRVADFSGDARMAARALQYPMLPSSNVNMAIGSSGVAGGAGQAGTNVVKKEKKERKAKTDSTNTSSAPAPVAGGANASEEIGSDLDDPEEGESDGEGEVAETGDLIIALYEKVQRVKNKWKITLKDGLISVGGKDYLFSKCSGEFEW